jgi:hypothetical protein
MDDFYKETFNEKRFNDEKYIRLNGNIDRINAHLSQ